MNKLGRFRLWEWLNSRRFRKRLDFLYFSQILRMDIDVKINLLFVVPVIVLRRFNISKCESGKIFQ